MVNVQVKCQVLLAKTGNGIKQEGNKHVIYLMARGAGMMMQPQSMCSYSLEYWLRALTRESVIWTDEEIFWLKIP